MMKTYFIATISLILLLPRVLRGQNLVANGSFEAYTNCAENNGQIESATGWFQLDGSADYFNSCDSVSKFLGVPGNYAGWQQARTGNAYAGFFLYLSQFSGSKKEDYFYRENIGTKLVQPLQQGETYTLSAYLSLADSSGYFSDVVSFCLSKDRPEKYKVPHDLLTCVSRVSVTGLSKRVDTKKWERIEAELTAKGGEKYLIISLFKEDMSLSEYYRALAHNKINSYGKNCYYYLDDVSVVKTGPATSRDPAREH